MLEIINAFYEHFIWIRLYAFADVSMGPPFIYVVHILWKCVYCMLSDRISCFCSSVCIVGLWSNICVSVLHFFIFFTSAILLASTLPSLSLLFPIFHIHSLCFFFKYTANKRSSSSTYNRIYKHQETEIGTDKKDTNFISDNRQRVISTDYMICYHVMLLFPHHYYFRNKTRKYVCISELKLELCALTFAFIDRFRFGQIWIRRVLEI